MDTRRRVLGIDLASKDWGSNGSALLEFDVTTKGFTKAVVPAIDWAKSETLTPESLALQIDLFARSEHVQAVALDGPQGWRDPSATPDQPGVGRRCEYQSRTQGKTGVYPQTYPGTQRPWIEFCVAVFDSLLKLDGVRLAEGNWPMEVPDGGYLLLEVFPTAIWRSSGLPVLPGKGRNPACEPYAAQLRDAFALPAVPLSISHDDLQALVAALPAAAILGGPVKPLPTGVASGMIGDGSGGSRRVEGFIWNACPPAMPDDAIPPIRAVTVPAATQGPAVRVTKRVTEQVNRAGKSQMQIATRGLPGGDKTEFVSVTVSVDGKEYQLVVGDSHAIWRSHQTDASLAAFEELFGQLGDDPDQWVSVTLVSPLPPSKK